MMRIGGITVNPAGEWAVQQARDLALGFGVAGLDRERIHRKPVLGGLINEYSGAA
jgi:hypothetical protein